MPYLGRVFRHAKDPLDREWGDPLFFKFLQTLAGPEQKRIENALLEYFPTVKNKHASYISTRKYDRPQPVLDERLWAMSWTWTIQHFSVAMGGADVVSPAMYAWNLRRWTTPGFPFVDKWPTKGQALDDDAFWEFYDCYQAADFEWDVLWGSTVKSDELRPPQKN